MALVGVFAGNAYAAPLLQEGTLTVEADEFALALDHVVPGPAQAMMRSKEQNIRGFLLDYYTYKLMARDARKQGLLDKPEVSVRADFLVNRLLSEALIEAYVDAQPLPDLERLAKEKYSINKSQYVVPAQVHAEHILIAVGDKRTQEDAYQLAVEVRNKLQANPSAFASIAEQYSDDASVAQNKGDLGYFTRGKMVKPFEDAAFSLKKGRLSEPVLSQFGYHLIRVLDQKKEQKQSFSDVKAALMERIRLEFRDSKRDEIVAKYRDMPSTIINDSAIAEFVEKILDSSR